MKRFTTCLLAAIATLSLVTSSCKKGDDGVQPANNSSTPAFVGKNLIMTSFQVDPAIDLDGDGKLDTDLTVFLRACDKDNTIVFEKNGTLSGSNGQLSCSDDESDPSAIKPSHWTYNEQTKIIHITKDSDATDMSDWKVMEASANGLKVELSVNEPGQSYKTIMTWKAL
ncbi:hypothetical protein GO730_37080 [Spirosoma sp. HMF3257]|uniref:Lipocalin-like domain-containing protein n=1 Tax=Spirosoma telluris TaxID=2183553 RepID=A0A327NW71_9BACT|nr:hypothetical protein [Spirosoma telluris]RAI78276.1 hypothetical protein HMF3257_37010 [Spirosoma telluris]